MATPTFSAKLPTQALAQLDELSKLYGISKSQVVIRAISDLYRKESQYMNTQQVAQKFGTVEYEGKEYTLTDVADFSNRPFTGWWGDADEGEAYTAEFSCPAVDDAGDEYRVYWQFDAIKGEEPEDNSNWPWSDKRIARVASE